MNENGDTDSFRIEKNETLNEKVNSVNDNKFNNILNEELMKTPRLEDNKDSEISIILTVDEIKFIWKIFLSFGNSHDINVNVIESRKNILQFNRYDIFMTLSGGEEQLKSTIDLLKSVISQVDLKIVEKKNFSSFEESKDIWIPRHISDLDFCNHLQTKFDPSIDSNHPGFYDLEYRERRQHIASLAFSYKHSQEIPNVVYTEQEIQTWSHVYRSLKKLYPTHACLRFNQIFAKLEEGCGYSEHNIPQLNDVSLFLQKSSGFRLRPVAGLLSPRDFLCSLAFRVFQCTQYVRHHDRPEHTVEPDCIHELIGHVPMLCDPYFAKFSQEIGLASIGASDKDIEKLSTLYWFTVEFGLCGENGETRAYGAGLLSAFGELKHALSDVPEKRPFSLEEISTQIYQDQDYQPLYFVADSFENMMEKLLQYSSTIQRPYQVQYDSYTQSLVLLNNTDIINKTIQSIDDELARLKEYLNITI
ncbi:DgyrCDS2609 [Dimorphilus gyrociliatus]|uniref:DgyrCDS2609 n=1 Tax=Dimorphilus gyrociliatus TaxID=2664684 RepID=A0A7I8VAS9_9ANNE|nr:DgyrCDS2609 [Dimorphilus gyrociliatus]